MAQDDSKRIVELLKQQNRTIDQLADMLKNEQAARLQMYKRVTMMERNIFDIRQKYAGGDNHGV